MGGVGTGSKMTSSLLVTVRCLWAIQKEMSDMLSNIGI